MRRISQELFTPTCIIYASTNQDSHEVFYNPSHKTLSCPGLWLTHNDELILSIISRISQWF